jgi:hypothetical protein
VALYVRSKDLFFASERLTMPLKYVPPTTCLPAESLTFVKTTPSVYLGFEMSDFGYLGAEIGQANIDIIVVNLREIFKVSRIVGFLLPFKL